MDAEKSEHVINAPWHIEQAWEAFERRLDTEEANFHALMAIATGIAALMEQFCDGAGEP